jgi:hypothetical protein
MTGYETNEELREVERECLARFRVKAAEMKAQNPGLKASYAFAKAVTELPRTADKYAFATQCLRNRGIPSLPLR